MAEVGSAYVTIIPSARGFKSALQKEIGGDLERVGRTSGEKTTRGFRGTVLPGFKKVGLLAGAALAGGIGVAALGLGKVFKDATNNASDLAESINVTGLVFKDSRGEVDRFVKTTARGLGQSERAARDATATFGGLLKNMGFGQEATVDWSIDLTALASDLGSAFNTDPADAVQAIGAALRGETEPIRRFNVMLDDASVRAKAVEMGLADTTAEVDKHGKAQATLALIMEQTADVQGDFANTSDGLANSQRILSASWEDATAKLGKVFLPIATKVVGWLAGDGIDGFLRFGDKVSDVIGWVSDTFNTFRSGWDDNTGKVSKATAGLRDFLTKTWDQISGVIGSAYDAIRGATSTFISIFQGFWDRFGRHITDFWSRTWGNIRQIIDAALRVIGGIFDVFAGLFTGDWSRMWGGIQKIVSGVWSAIQAVVKTAIDLVRTAIGAAMAAISQLWSEAWERVRRVLSGAWDAMKRTVSGAINAILGWIKDLPARAVSRLGNLGELLVGQGRKLIRGLWNGARQIWDDMWNWLGGLGSKIASKLNPANWFGSGDGPGINVNWGSGLGMTGGSGRLRYAGVPRNRASMLAETLGLPGVVTSTHRPGAITATGNPSYHGANRAVDISGTQAQMRAIFFGLRNRFKNVAKELIFSPMGGMQVWNGRDHRYSDPRTIRDHWDHVHFALANGGYMKRPFAGSVVMAEKHPEIVAPEPMLRRIVREEGGRFPDRLRLVVDGHEFHAYIDGRLDVADERAARNYMAGSRA